jgi:hypothetical protein
MRGAITGVFMLAAAGAVGYGGAYVVSPYVKDNEAAIMIRAGKVVNTNLETGVQMQALLPKVEIIKYPTTLQTITVGATENDSVTIRTAERARIYGEFKVKYVIDKTDENFGSIYTLQRADELSDIEDDISDYTIPAAIETYKAVKTIEVNDNLDQIGLNIAKELQSILDARGFTYVRVQDVVPTGMGLSDKANADLELIVSEERKISLLEQQALTAQKEAEIIADQTRVTTEALSALRDAGVPSEQLSTLYCLQLMRVNDKVGEPFAAGCMGGTQTTPVGVSVPGVSAPRP